MKQLCIQKHLSLNDSGMVAPLFGLLIIPIVMSIGIAVDYSRVMRVQDRLQSSVDAAIVAAMAPNTNEAERVQKAQQMFLLNFYKGADAEGTRGRRKKPVRERSEDFLRSE